MNLSRLFAAVLLPLLAPAPALALPDDRNQAIEITAERALRDEKAGYTVYTGDVILAQGSLLIEAARLTIFHDSEAANRIVATGSPATLSQQPEIDKGIVTARAGRIIYEKSQERVLLREAATIEQDGAVVSGESIDYFMAQQRVRADAGNEDSGDRVQVIIPAEVIASNQDENDATTSGAAQDSDETAAPETPEAAEDQEEPESSNGSPDSP